MKKRFFSCIGGGGNARITSHNQGFSLIEAFNNLALWGEKKFVNELKRTYKLQRGGNNILDCHANARNDVKRHTENNSPKYRMVSKMKGNNFFDKVHSLFTTHHSLKRAGATHVALCESVGSYFRHWCGAFTLAEVLVTLGIIGVVSAMTVPTLMQNYQRQSYVTQLHKTYNEMSQALLRYQTDRNALNLREAGMSSQAEVNNFISSYFKVVNSCLDSSTVTPCFANQSEYKKISGATASGFDNDADGLGMSFILANGTSIRPWLSNGRNFIVMVVDVNGQKGPNILGRDFFDMCIDVNGNIDTCLRNGGTFPHTEAQRETEFNDVCIADSASIAGCFGKILNDNWQMNY